MPLTGPWQSLNEGWRARFSGAQPEPVGASRGRVLPFGRIAFD